MMKAGARKATQVELPPHISQIASNFYTSARPMWYHASQPGYRAPCPSRPHFVLKKSIDEQICQRILYCYSGEKLNYGLVQEFTVSKRLYRQFL